jgi:hypothetical protein
METAAAEGAGDLGLAAGGGSTSGMTGSLFITEKNNNDNEKAHNDKCYEIRVEENTPFLLLLYREPRKTSFS